MSVMKGGWGLGNSIQTESNKIRTVLTLANKQIDGGRTERGRGRERNGEGSEKKEGSVSSFYTVTLHDHLDVFLHVKNGS